MKLSLLLFCVSSVFSSSIQKFNGRIIGGDPANISDYPHVAAIYTSTAIGRYFCAGSILSSRWILTAGHCVENAVSFSIQVGSSHLREADSNRRTITAVTSVIHPDFNNETLQNDIGLIQLPSDLQLNAFINVIKLPTEAVAEDVDAITIGWGQTDDDNSGPVETLNQVEVVTLLNLHCQYTYGSQVVDSMVCAIGSFNEGICIGDIGGPLLQNVDGEATHIGIASFLSGNGCESEDPSGYTRTFSYVDWIKNVTNIA